MSEKDRKDWNEGTDFDSLADDHPDEEIFDDSIMGFADYDDDHDDRPDGGASPDNSLDEDLCQEDAADAGQDGVGYQPDGSGPQNAAVGRVKRGPGVSSFGVGFLFVASVLVSAVAGGWALLLATGTDPRSLWQPEILLKFDQLLNFAAYPANIPYMVALGVVFLAVLGSLRLARTVRRANARTRDAEAMLDRLTALTMDNQGDWMSPEFKSFPPAEEFVTKVLGSFRLQEARQMRLLGLEGELHRLQKALANNSQSDLTGRFDHPSAGALADEMVRYFDDRDAAVKDAESERSHRFDNGADLLGRVQDARRSNVSVLERTATAGAAVGRLTAVISDLVRNLEEAAAADGVGNNAGDLLQNIRETLKTMGNAPVDASVKVPPEFNDMVDRGNKLAFQIAMEVTRLGPRGERLIPMAKELEDLTAEFRQVADELGVESPSGAVDGNVVERVSRPLEALSEILAARGGISLSGLAEMARGSLAEVTRISKALAKLAEEFTLQEERLSKLGTSFAEVTGTEFAADEVEVPEVDLQSVETMDLTRQDEFSTPLRMKPLISGPPVNPFKGQESILNPTGYDFDAETQDQAPLSDSGEKVYDLESFGSAPLDLPLHESGPEATDEVYELSDFGAAPVDEPEPAAEEEVYELSDFGAAAVEEPEAAAEEEVYELSDFGAAAVEEPEAAAEDEVYELSDFGAAAVEEPEAAAEEEVYDLSEFDATPLP
jgi:hypothetical protein